MFFRILVAYCVVFFVAVLMWVDVGNVGFLFGWLLALTRVCSTIG